MTAFTREVSLTKEDIALLHEVITSIHAFHNLEKMIRYVLLKIKNVFDIDCTSIALHDRQEKEFYCYQTMAKKLQEVMQDHAHNIDFSDSREIEKTILLKNNSLDIKCTNELDMQNNMAGHFILCIPLIASNEFLGILYIVHTHNSKFSENDLRLLEILSTIIAVTIENTRLYEDLHHHAKTLEKENIRLKTELQNRFNKQGIIGSSAALQQVFHLLDKAVVSTTTVLIQGETGTGKELIAKAIHYNGPLRNKPFMAENCAALSENLLESELFGHVKGAFTGAIADTKGLFELARGGTVFLDDINDMSAAMQSKLLRVLQEHQIRPVGGNSYHQVDFRLISSTNLNLYDEVKKGNFREDLFYRIQTFPIVLPPLRERKEDIALLASYFLEKYAAKFKRPSACLTPKALDILTQYNWPGNIRELQNEIERIITLSNEGEDITSAYLSKRIRGKIYQDDPEGETSNSLAASVSRLERRMVIDSLSQTGGNRSQAAVILGLTRQGLLNKISRYNIDL